MRSSSLRPARVTVGVALARDGSLAVSATDSGIGIAAEDLERVLHPFGQVDNEFNRRHAGTGLGLSLVKALIEMHGGTLEIDSRAGAGTVAMLTFPAARVLRSRPARAIA